MTKKSITPTRVMGAMEERHYTPAELAALWNFSAATIRRLVQDEQGVLRLQGMGATAGKRQYTTYSIPASVANRLHERLSHKPLQTQLPRRAPRSIVRLRHGNGGMAE
jgi:hypothetical protein